MKFQVLFFFMILMKYSAVFAVQTRTFSCGGVYNGDGSHFPVASIHFETKYEENRDGAHIELSGEDSKILLTGRLNIKDSSEFLKTTVKMKDSGLIIFNNNSQLGFPAEGKFNFVGVWLENLGHVQIDNAQIFPRSASFQCQTYRD